MTTEETTHILLVEDSEDDALLLETVLAPVMPGLVIHRVDCAADMTEALKQKIAARGRLIHGRR